MGKAPGRYNLYLGGDVRGQRLNRLYRENIDEAGILAALEPLFAAVRAASAVPARASVTSPSAPATSRHLLLPHPLLLLPRGSPCLPFPL